MKIRIKGNSIRLRLTKSEIEKFRLLGYLEEKTEFGSTTLTYSLTKDDSVTDLYASLVDSKITVHVPTSILIEWTTTNRIGFENKQKITAEKELFILIEKDFVCIDNTVEDQSDNYPNPNAVC